MAKPLIDYLNDLPEPYRSKAMDHIAARPFIAKEPCDNQFEALSFTLPVGSGSDPFWAPLLDAPQPRHRTYKGQSYTKVNGTYWMPKHGDEIEASADGRLWAKRTFVAINPTNVGGKYIVIDQYGRLQFCQMFRRSRQSPFRRA